MPDANDKWWLVEPDTLRPGIGVVLHWKPTGWIVHRTLADSPAAVLGIQQSDVLVSINDYGLAAKEDIREAFRHTVMTQQPDVDWSLEFARNREKMSSACKPALLRDLIERENASGGLHDYCYSCYECWPETNGWGICGKEGCSNRCVVT